MQKRTSVPGTGTNFMPREFSHGSPGLGPNEGGGSASLEEGSAALSGSDKRQQRMAMKRGTIGFMRKECTALTGWCWRKIPWKTGLRQNERGLPGNLSPSVMLNPR